MLSVEDNEAVTRVGPGTVMGNFMREYWLPAMLSSEIENPDSDPVRVMMLGEQLIGFRDSDGKVGLIQNLCPHRGASLFFGRNEESGIRCVYHGWKFNTEGRCIDMPNEPPESNFKDRIRATAYPTLERAGMVFVYMGSRETPPPMPDIEVLGSPEVSISCYLVPCNWLQVLEGNIDTAHAQFLHAGSHEVEWYPEGSFIYYGLKQRYARFAAADTDYGAIYGAYRPGPEGYNYWRIGQFLFPCWTSPATGMLGQKVEIQCWVPMDDTHTLAYRVVRRIGGAEPAGQDRMQGDAEMLPNNSGWYGRFNTVYNIENDFMIDREEQRQLGSFTGMPFGNGPEDGSVQTSMGPVLPREIEHLGTSDLMIIRVRQRFLEAAKALADHKLPPPALDTPSTYAVRCGSILIPESADWLEYIEPLSRVGVSNPPPDPLYSAGAGFRTKGYRHERSGPMF